MNSVFNDCVFGFDKDVNELFWEIEPERYIVGVIGVERCTFQRCRFTGISFMGTKEVIDSFKNGIG